MLTHKGITNYISNDPQNIPINSLSNKSTKFLSLTTVSFIVFLREIFATMINGVSVVFANEEESINPLKLIELINNTNPDAFGSTPSRMLQYLELEKIRNVMKNFKVIIVGGGEMFPSKLYNTLKNCAGAEIYNSYGPTEITIASHGKLMENENVSEGKTLLNVIDSIRDIDGNPLPPGVVGEVYIGGSGVARGYLNNKKLTEEKFLEISETSYYKTGDLGKKDEFGELYVSGRVDSQVKVRGLRIEVGEIESVISKNSNINSLVVCVKDVDSEEHLCAYYTSKKEIDINELRDITVDKLPKYMVPSYFIQLENFPMTPNGKIDIRNLPLPEESDYGVENFVNPENELEESIFNICSNIMGKANFGVTNDLFQIGFTSLSIIKLISKISDDYGVELNLVSIMREGTIRKISQEILKASPSEELIFKDDKIYSLTQNQLGVYFDCIKNQDTLIYNMPKCIRLNKNKDLFDLSNINTSNINTNDSYINASKLKNVILKAIEKHSFMKTHLYLNNGKIYQRKNDNLKVDIEIHKGTVDKKIKKNFIKPFDLFKGPLFRFEIYEDENEVFLLWDCHHIISDGFSTIIFLKDLAKLYEGKNVEIEKYTGFDLALEESEIEKSDLYNEAENYFDNRMCDFEGETGLTPDINGKENDGLLKEKSFSLNKDRVETFCKNNSITPLTSFSWELYYLV
ncbi:non-ribosomal peptide synthetase [Methanobrevibacter arboriphilus]|uniref:non-ribosomal peptide synthetase n=1 Tax=Methanobrevibacter arboriphilus TaxID=39441 RepID=UPI0006D17AED|nr:non-ribosomal peptide synthetase [Methanobrevibacter arboriphilus]